MHLSLPLFSFTQWKDKCASYSFTTKKLTHSMCRVSLVVKYIFQIKCLSLNIFYVLAHSVDPDKLMHFVVFHLALHARGSGWGIMISEYWPFL